MPTPDVRVKVKDTGAHITISRERFKADPDIYQELKNDPYGPDGTPAPPEYPETSAKTATNTADADKENS
jgi:hypothetical protein